VPDPSEDDITRRFHDAYPDLLAICSREDGKYRLSRQNWIIASYTMCALLFAGVCIWLAVEFWHTVHESIEFNCTIPATRIAMLDGAESGNWQDSQSTLNALGHPTPAQTAFDQCVQNHPAADVADMLIIVTVPIVMLTIAKVLVESLAVHYHYMRGNIQAILGRASTMFDSMLLLHIEVVTAGLTVLSLLTLLGFIMSPVLMMF